MKNRLDTELFKRDLVATRSQADNYIKLGKVFVNEKIVKKIITEQLEKRNWTNRIIMEGLFLPTKELRYEK